MADCIIAGSLLVLCAPVILAAIATVRIGSSGPGIYSQSRLGFNRRQFTLYKIRTMKNNCEAKSGIRWATTNDPRVTWVGRFLRKTHIDELPQLWNVLRGDMTLVGPRPERPEIVKELEPQIPGYAHRLDVYPGVTGLAQVQLPPDSSVDSVRRKLTYDLYYAANFDLWLDLRLIVATSAKVFGIVDLMCFLLRIPGPGRVEVDRRVYSASSPGMSFLADPTNHMAQQPDLSRV